jgi:hypothetical protein
MTMASWALQVGWAVKENVYMNGQVQHHRKIQISPGSSEEQSLSGLLTVTFDTECSATLAMANILGLTRSESSWNTNNRG